MLNGKLIAEELRSLRSKKNKTIEEVSTALDMHFNTLSKYEKDASDMKLETLEKILKYYEVDEYIFFKVLREYNHLDDVEII